jgi:hypothetical protein
MDGAFAVLSVVAGDEQAASAARIQMRDRRIA